jgi:hypothetical protein
MKDESKMSTLSKEEIMNSQSSIYKYMKANHIERYDRTPVWIQIKRKNTLVFDKPAEIFIHIETNYWELEIDSSLDFFDEFHSTYRDVFQNFRYENENLIIKAKDLKENKIEIIISPKREHM